MASLRVLRSVLGVLTLGLVASAAACTGETSEGEVAGDENDLTSITARSRTIEFVGTVYVEPGASDDSVLQAVRTQTQTAFGPLRTADMAVNSRELKEVDPATFVKRNVRVVDPGGGAREMVEVKYTYKDDAVVGMSLARRSSVPLALMNPGYRSQTERILRECTPNDSHAREFASSAWYIFEPRLPQCQEAIRAEQQKVDEDRARLADPRSEVAKSDVERLYIPITARLGADKTNRGESYPDYHRLYRGGVKQDKLVVGLVFGMIDHDDQGGPSGDYNWGELMTALDLVFEAQGDFVQSADGPDRIDLSRFTLPSGRVIDSPSMKDLVKLKTGGSALRLSYDDSRELQKQFAERIAKKWLTIEHPIKVAVGDEAPRDFAIQFQIYFGAGSDSRPHKYATRNTDVFIYNGHSSIGYGPLDPRNFTAADFSPTYQIMWVDGCVSYNYYHKDYIPLKEGGTKNLDLVTNGVEAPAFRGGKANGQFLVALLNGQGSSYRDLLLAARDTEALRVVDGELDNEYRPDRMRVTITNR